MKYGEMQPVPEETMIARAAEEMCEEAAFYDECERRIPELGTWGELHYLGYLDDRESWHLHRWQDWLDELDEMDGEALAADLGECAEYIDGAGWIEDEHGGAEYVELVYDDEDNEE